MADEVGINVPTDPSAAPAAPAAPTDAPATAPAPPPDWRSGLPDELKGEKSLADFKDLGSLAKSYVETKRLVGNSISLPPKDAKPEDIQKWKDTVLPRLTAAGLVAAPPVAPAQYELTQPEAPGIPAFNDARLDFAKTGFHDLKLTNEQAQGVLNLYAQDLSRALKWAEEQNLATIETMRQEWGDLLFDKKWDKAVSAVDPIAKMAGIQPQELKEYFDATRKGNDPMMFRVLAAVGDMISEDQGIGVEVAGVGGVDQATAEIERLESGEAYKNPRHPGHQDALARREALYKLKYGTGKVDLLNR